jgi:hypothetical protein
MQRDQALSVNLTRTCCCPAQCMRLQICTRKLRSTMCANRTVPSISVLLESKSYDDRKASNRCGMPTARPTLCFSREGHRMARGQSRSVLSGYHKSQLSSSAADAENYEDHEAFPTIKNANGCELARSNSQIEATWLINVSTECQTSDCRPHFHSTISTLEEGDGRLEFSHNITQAHCVQDRSSSTSQASYHTAVIESSRI